ncbi:hypothetical protein OG555_36295 [Kribbella sp. NBC_01484]|uniref:hypothetical protein n=1 Tax=Kribbella sp. NBC_01484 TaxID=2903579 RepID=UPI002E3584A0|nr:hypothetical protein [Kribbella sp. NBC_01484]
MRTRGGPTSLEVLHVPGCPNLPPLLDHLSQVTGLPVVTRVVRTDADAVRFGMTGSPTLLVHGVDPFPAGECGLSCRLYRDESGAPVAVPSIEQLRAAISPPGSAD